MNIREAQIEDVLATYPDLLKDILGIADLTLIARQKILPSGNRLDLLFLFGKRILLLELKAERFKAEFLNQIGGYAAELTALQRVGKLVEGDIHPFILCTDFTEANEILCKKQNIVLIKYSPDWLMRNFFERIKGLAPFISLKPTNHGLWNIHLLNRILYALEEIKNVNELTEISKLSGSSIKSYLKLAEELLLVAENNKNWTLTKDGRKYIEKRDSSGPIEFVSSEQSKILQNIIIQNPFASGAIFGIYSIVESTFNLAKNTYPVPAKLLMEHFRQISGRYFEWSSDKTALDSMKMYSNYSIDLGLLGKNGNQFYLTPDGIRFILLLNLHKSIKIVDALGISSKNA